MCGCPVAKVMLWMLLWLLACPVVVLCIGCVWMSLWLLACVVVDRLVVCCGFPKADAPTDLYPEAHVPPDLYPVAKGGNPTFKISEPRPPANL